MNSLKNILIAGLLSIVAMVMALPAQAAEKTAPAEGTKEKKPKGIPFNGKIKSVDKTHKTITIDREKSNTFQVTSETKITKAGKPATFDDAVVGEVIGGQAHEKDGKLIAASIRIGPKPGAEEKAKKEENSEQKPKKKKAE